MTRLSKYLGLMAVAVLLFSTGLWAQPAPSQGQKTQLPKVFLIGEFSQEFEEMSVSYRSNLLSVTDFDMEAAYDKWVSMLQEMEAYAEQINFDIKGVKLWVKVFWEPDGSIKHIAYYLKPKSRNIDTEELTAFFSSFINNYRFPLVTSKRYTHYGSAAFPTQPKRLKQN